MENNQYWKEYYQEHERQSPSKFFQFCSNYIFKDDVVVDMGAGDGRDTIPLSRVAKDVICVEPNNEIIPFTCFDSVRQMHKEKIPFTVMYARWFFHAVEEEVADITIRFCKINGATLMAEMRAEETNDDSHYRRPINGSHFVRRLVDLGFDIKYYEKDRGFSKVGDDDPLLIRVIATCNHK